MEAAVAVLSPSAIRSKKECITLELIGSVATQMRF